MKKLFTLAVIASAVLLTGCGADENSDKLQVGIIQVADNGAFTDMREGFLYQMGEYNFDESNTVFDYENAQGDISTLNSIAQKMVNSSKDIIITIATQPTQSVVGLESKIPVFYMGVSDPLSAGVITDIANPDKNATGVTNVVPTAEIFNLAQEVTPDVETFGLVYNTSEVNSVVTMNEAKAYMDANGLKYKEKIVTSSSEVQQAVQSMIGSIDAMFCSNDSMIQSAMSQISEIAKDAGIPVYGSSAVMIDSGCFATISISDFEIGNYTADMVNEYINGTPIEEIPANFVSNFDVIVNKTTAETIGVSIDSDIFSGAIIIE